MAMNWRRIAAASLALAGALLLAGCLVTPGKFASQLTLMKDGSFGFTYDGEIQMLALSELARMAKSAGDEFAPTPCYDDETFEERECTGDELAQQKADWELSAVEGAEKAARDVEMAKAMLGGIDPSSPEAGREIADRLQRQHGWNKVEYLGDGLFDVEFAIEGRTTHDFVFPVMERLTLGNSFLTAILRDGHQVRIDAPGFAGPDGADPMRGMMGMMGLTDLEKQSTSGAEDGQAGSASSHVVFPHGRFIVVTDGTILANNTDVGPTPHAEGQQLVWEIGPGSRQPPMALIDLSR